MPAISKQSATQKVLAELSQLELYDLVEVFNELSPTRPMSSDSKTVNREALFQSITAQIESGLEIEELVDLWNVVFPRDRNVWYDEESDSLHLNEEPEHVESSE